MIAMQYTIVLPADYDMAVIRRRIEDKGPLLDGFPGLEFKAYLHARRDGAPPSRDNLYAPFYLWRGVAGLQAFLDGPGFAALCEAFGRPRVRLWPLWDRAGTASRAATHASRAVAAVPDGADLRHVRERAAARLRDDLSAGALAGVSGFDPQTRTAVSLRLWDRIPPPCQSAQDYAVGYVALPHA